MKKGILFVLTAVLFACSQPGHKEIKEKKAESLLEEYINGKNILVVAHRGDWRNACENSLLAISNAVDMGVDMVEIDLKITADSQLILMHDYTLDRTTTGKGYVKEKTLEEIKSLYLKDGAGHKTEFKVPTLKEALLTAKGKVLINLDQSYKYFEYVLPVLLETGTINQVVMKGYNKPIAEVKENLGIFYDSVQYIPIIKLGTTGYRKLVDEAKNYAPECIEFTFPSDTIATVNEFFLFQNMGTRVWVNALWPEHNAGHHDDKAYLEDPKKAYGWLISKGVNVIQSDRPSLLLEYLREKGLHE